MTIEQLIAHLQQQCRRYMQAEVCVEVYREGDGEVFIEPLKRWPEVEWVIRDPHLKTYTQDVSLDNCDAFPVLVLSATETQLKVDKVEESKPEPDEEAQEEQ